MNGFRSQKKSFEAKMNSFGIQKIFWNENKPFSVSEKYFEVKINASKSQKK